MAENTENNDCTVDGSCEPTTEIGIENPALAPTGSAESAAMSTPATNGAQPSTVTAVTSSPAISTTATPTVSNPASDATITGTVQCLESSSGNGVSKGAIAGIAIGTSILGAAIASLIAILLFKKRYHHRKSNPPLAASSAAALTSYADSTPELTMESKIATAQPSPYTRVLQAPVPGPVPQSIHPAPPNIESFLPFLPPLATTSDAKDRILALFDQIYRHVDVYYRDVHASITPSMEPDLARFGTRDTDIAELLQVCARPTVVLKHALGAWVVGITGPARSSSSRGDEGSVFPEELQRSCVERASGNNNLATSTAKALHRRLSAYLYTTSLSANPPHASRASLVPKTSAAMREAAEQFSLTFFPWGNPSCSDAEREEDLLRILCEALDLRVWLFGQADEWVFEWGEAGKNMVGVCVRPGVLRVDEHGERSGVLERETTSL